MRILVIRRSDIKTDYMWVFNKYICNCSKLKINEYSREAASNLTTRLNRVSRDVIDSDVWSPGDDS